VSDVAVHVISSGDPVRLEETGDRGGCPDRLGDRHIHQRLCSEDRPLGAVEVDGRDEERPAALPKAVRQPLGGKGFAHEELERGDREKAGRHVGPAPREEVGPLEPEAGHGLLADGPDELRKVAGGDREGSPVVDGATPQVERVVALLDQDVVELPRPDTVGHEGGHH
jgi:hypothetical protein